MNKRLELALQLFGAGIIFFIITYFFFAVVVVVVKVVLWCAVIITTIAGIYELWEYFKNPKQ